MTSPRDYSLGGADSLRAIESGLANAEWYRTPIDRKRMKQLMQRRDSPAIRDTVIWLGLMVVFAGIAVWQWFSIWSILSLFAYGVLYGSASDSRWHEASHGTAFRTQWMNTLVYQIACFMIMRNPTVRRWTHTRHHTDTLIVGRDPEIVAQRPPELVKLALNFFGLLDVPQAMVATVRYAAGRLTEDEKSFIPDSERSRVSGAARVWLAIYAATIAACVVTGSIIPIVLIGLPRCYGAWHHLMTGLIQHGGLADDVTDHRLNSRTAYMNPVSRFIYWNMNYHVEHHMFPMVPFHALPALHEEIKHDLPAPSPSIAAALRELVPVLVAQRRDPSVFIHRELSAPGAV